METLHTVVQHSLKLSHWVVELWCVLQKVTIVFCIKVKKWMFWLLIKMEMQVHEFCQKMSARKERSKKWRLQTRNRAQQIKNRTAERIRTQKRSVQLTLVLIRLTVHAHSQQKMVMYCWDNDAPTTDEVFYLFIVCTLTFQLNMEMETNVIFHYAVGTGLQNVLLISQTGLKGHILGQTDKVSYRRPHILFYKNWKMWCLRAG